MLIKVFYLLRAPKKTPGSAAEEEYLKEKTELRDGSQEPLSCRTRSTRQPVATIGARMALLALAALFTMFAWSTADGLKLSLYFCIDFFAIPSMLGGSEVATKAPNLPNPGESLHRGSRNRHVVSFEMLAIVLAIGLAVGLCKRWLIDPDTLKEWGSAVTVLFNGGISSYWQARAQPMSASLGMLLAVALAVWLAENPDAVIHLFTAIAAK